MITFDYLLLKSFYNQQKDFFENSRINKIQQPTRRELILTLRNQGISKKFYINISPVMYHVCFMSAENEKKRSVEIPKTPPMFCMLLRKYLENSKILKVCLPEGERILELYTDTYNELGDKVSLCLAIELMGKHSNIILYNADTNIIIGCAHNVGADKSSVREVYGQIPYTYPPSISDNSFIYDRYAFLLSFKSDIYSNSDVNSKIDDYYAHLMQKNKFNYYKNHYLAIVMPRLDKTIKSLEKAARQLNKTKSADKYRLYGDLIMANMYNLEDYSSSVNVYDYENDKNIVISMDSSKSLKDNANIFYKKYNKSKKANMILENMTEDYVAKKNYLEQLLYSVESAQNLSDLSELKDEVESENPISKYDKQEISILKIELENETRIYIGKNNKQNDYIISKLASDEDLWFHAKDCPGSHVLLKTQHLTDDLILKCAKFAKKYSSASESSKVGVIYTKRKYIRKPPKAPLGYVTYRNEKEIIID